MGDGVEFLRGLDETERQCMSICQNASPLHNVVVH